MRYFNLALNDLKSSAYEYAIKLGSMICRHPNLTHVDLTRVGFKREEVIFLGMACRQSETLQSIHMTANEIPYYDRVFLRAVMAARVDYSFKSDHLQKEIANNTETN